MNDVCPVETNLYLYCPKDPEDVIWCFCFGGRAKRCWSADFQELGWRYTNKPAQLNGQSFFHEHEPLEGTWACSISLDSLCSTAIFFSPEILLCIVPKEKWFKRFFPPIVNMKSYPHVLPEEWMKTTKEARIVSWGKTHCNLLLLCTTCIMYVCACPHRIHCSRSAPSHPCPSCIRSDTLHHGWNPTLEEKHGEVMSSKKGQYITPQDYQSLWVHFYFLISPESDEGRSSP